MKHFTQEQIDHMNQKWLNQKKDALPDSVKEMFSQFDKKVWTGVPQKNKAAILKIEKRVALRTVENTLLDFETLKNIVEHEAEGQSANA